MNVTPISIKARREALGLGQENLARQLGVSQATLNRWERGQRNPEHPECLDELLTNLETAMINLEDKIYQDGEEQGHDDGTCVIVVFRTDEQFQAADASAAESSLPASFYRIAAARAAVALRDELKIAARIETAQKEGAPPK